MMSETLKNYLCQCHPNGGDDELVKCEATDFENAARLAAKAMFDAGADPDQEVHVTLVVDEQLQYSPIGYSMYLSDLEETEAT